MTKSKELRYAQAKTPSLLNEQTNRKRDFNYLVSTDKNRCRGDKKEKIQEGMCWRQNSKMYKETISCYCTTYCVVVFVSLEIPLR